MAEIKYLDQTGLGTVKSILDGLFSPKSHNHDGRYYTETEIDTKLAGKADSSHGTHVTSDAQTWSGVKTFNSAISFGVYGGRFSEDIRSTWRESIFGTTSNNSYFRTVRTDKTIDGFSEIYGSGITWSTGDTHGYLSVSYSSKKAWIAGGNGNALNWSTHIITGENIGSQSVNYANSAGSIAWTNVSGKPTKLSEFTDDILSGKYLPLSGGTITTKLSTDNPTYSNAPLKFDSSYNDNNSSSYRYRPWFSGQDSVNNYGYGVTINCGLYRNPGYDNGGFYLGMGWDGRAYDKIIYFEKTGKIIADTFKGSLDGNASTSSISSAVADSGNSTSTTMAYSKAGLAYADYTWLAAWNGYELRAVNKSQFAQASHNHNDTYYTETEIDTLLAGKANSSHGTHLPGTVPVSHTNKALSAKGWYVIAQDNKKITHSSVRLVIQRTYNNANNEAYTFEINCAYNGSTSITQVSGVANTQLITKIAVYNPPSPYDRIIYIYYNGTNTNDVKVCCMGDFTAQAPTAASLKTTNVREFPTYPIGFFSEEIWSIFSPIGHTHTKADVGLGNVDNTADANKSVNYANSAGAVAWTNVTNRPTALSSFTNDSGYITNSPSYLEIMGNAVAYIDFHYNNSTSDFDARIACHANNQLRFHGHLTPSTSTVANAETIGLSNRRFNTIYALNGNFSGKVEAAQGVFDISDERLKNIIDNVNVDIDKLSELRKVYFNFKNDPDKRHIGVIAQDVQKIYPEIVEENNEGMLTVDYSKLSVIALDAVDQLNQKNKELEDRLNKIENLLKDKGIL